MLDRRLVLYVTVLCSSLQRALPAQLLPYDSAESLQIREEFAYSKPLHQTITFNAVTYSDIHINEDGAFSFDISIMAVNGADRYAYDRLWVAPFGADVDGNGGGSMYHQTLDTTATTTLATISQYVNTAYPESTFTATGATIITWEDVKKYGVSSTNTNTFQAAIVTQGTSTFVLFLYDTISWWPAVVGLSGGDSTNYYTVCDTQDAAARVLPWKSNRSLSSCGGTSGVYVFPVHISSWAVVSPCVPVFIPGDCSNSGTNPNRNTRCGSR